MSYPDALDYINFLFERLQEFEVAAASNQPKSPGCPQVYSDASLIVFFNHDAQGHPSLSCTTSVDCGSPGVANPPQSDKGSVSGDAVERYKALSPKLAQFITFVGDWATPLGEVFSQEVVYQDKSLFKAKGPVWHATDRAADRVPEK